MGAREISRIDIQTSFTSDELGIFFAALINIHDIFPFAAIVESSSWHNKLRSGRTQLGSTWRRSLSSFSLTRLAARSFTSEMGNLTHLLFQPIRRKIKKISFDYVGLPTLTCSVTTANQPRLTSPPQARPIIKYYSPYVHSVITGT